MFSIERLREIIQLMNQNKSVSVKALSNKFFVSEATIRRDLDKLEKQGVIKKTYGGAVLLEGLDTEIPLYVREGEQRTEKEDIGRLAARLVKDNDILIMDSSSTTAKMVPNLRSKQNLTVITNGAKTAIELGEFLHTQVYCTGGNLRENSLSYIGDDARERIERYYVDTAFFSCRSLSLDNGFYDSNTSEATLRRTMMQHSRKSVLLCDHTKFDRHSFCKIGNYDIIDYVVTDIKPSHKWLNLFESLNVELLYAH